MSAWHVTIPSKRLEELRGDAAFAESITLARMANAIRFSIAAGANAGDGPVGDSQRSSSLLLTAATCSEVLRTLKRTEKHFKAFPAHAEFIVPFTTDSDVGALHDVYLKWLRDKAVFHYDEDVPRSGLADLAGAWTFAEGDREGLFDVVYPLADFVAFRAVLGEAITEADLITSLENLLSRTAQLATDLLHGIDSLLGQILAAYGFSIGEESH